MSKPPALGRNRSIFGDSELPDASTLPDPWSLPDASTLQLPSTQLKLNEDDGAKKHKHAHTHTHKHKERRKSVVSADEVTTMAQVRKEIDRLDREIVGLLGEFRESIFPCPVTRFLLFFWPSYCAFPLRCSLHRILLPISGIMVANHQ